MQRRAGLDLKPLRRKHPTPEDKRRASSESSIKCQREKIRFTQALKVERGCTDCGYNSHPEALDFDHISTDKIANITSLCHRAGWKSLMEEIEKCEVVCANCHRIRTVSRRTPLCVNEV